MHAASGYNAVLKVILIYYSYRLDEKCIAEYIQRAYTKAFWEI